MANIYLSNLGCKLNQAELESYARRFEADGHALVGHLDEADVHVVNSCTVTHVAARDSRKLARRALRQAHQRQDGSTPRTVLTGCYATDQPLEAKALEGVSLVVDNADKDDLVDQVYEQFPDLRPSTPAVGEVPVSFVPLEFGNTRAALKVEDGCNMTCAFCIIPSTRGRQRSYSVERAVDELQLLVDRGYQEVVITGVQISSYRDGDQRLVDLVRALLEDTSAPRLRLTSIAPWQFDRRLLDLWPNERLCRHFHLSLQSGCTPTLRRMRRPYSASQYADLLSEIRERVPGVAITTDVIVGFPEESDEEFEQSLEFVRQAGFTRTHVFPYSERPGTRSVSMHDSVSAAEKKQRVQRMRAVGETCAASFTETQVGTPLQVLWEREATTSDPASQPTVVVGTSDNYIRMQNASVNAPRVGTLSTVVASSAERDRLLVNYEPIPSAHAPRPLPIVSP